MKKTFVSTVAVDRVIKTFEGCRLCDDSGIRATFRSESNTLDAMSRINMLQGWKAIAHPGIKNMIQISATVNSGE